MTILKPFIQKTTAEMLGEIDAWRPDEEGWIFRGQSDSKWGLETSLERVLNELPEKFSKALNRERGLIRRFQREAHHYLPHLPDDGNIPEWLAIMQHHGAPTRLLDWTHSFDIALFFAAIDQREQHASVWAINSEFIDDQLPSKVKDIYKDDRNCSKRKSFIGLADAGPGVAKLNSYRISQRQALQQATFLVPLDVSQSFEENLRATVTHHERRYVKRWTLLVRSDPR